MTTDEYKKLAYATRFERNKNDKLPFPRSRKYVSGANTPMGFILVETIDQKTIDKEREKIEIIEKERRDELDLRLLQEKEASEQRTREAAALEEMKRFLEHMPETVKVGSIIEVRILSRIIGKNRWATVIVKLANGSERKAEMSNCFVTDEDYGKIALAKIQKMGFDSKTPSELSFNCWKT